MGIETIVAAAQGGGTGCERVACFAAGTLIATVAGQKRVEEIRPGDRVLTRDDGAQEVSWVGAKEIGWQALAANPHLQPVMVRAGALGPGSPDRDLVLSPNHRLLVRTDPGCRGGDDGDALVAARHLVGNPGIHEIEAIGVTYVHLMFARHELILSEGAWSESFQPGDFSLGAVGNAGRLEILELFPALRSPEGIARYAPARRILRPEEPLKLV